MSRQGEFRYQGNRDWNIVNDCGRRDGGCGRRDEWNVVDDCRRDDYGRRRCDGRRDRGCCDDRRDRGRCHDGYRRHKYGGCDDRDVGCSIS